VWKRLRGEQVSPEINLVAQQLSKRIEATGPISILEYMRAANTAYYAKGDVFGVDGDFITAPEISQMFGEMVGIWLADLWLRQNTPDNCHYVELGPGRGSLASDALRTMQRFGMVPSVHFVETSEAMRAVQLAKVPVAQFCATVDDIPDDGPLLIVANEFFDALPIKQLIATHAGWRERVVARDRSNKFLPMPGLNSVDAMVPAEFRAAPTSSVYETCPEASAIIYELAGRLAAQGGVLLIIDYGYSLPGLGSTLQAVKHHQSVDPFENPGEYDLTAHVNFLEIANLARMRNLRVSGPSEQGSWLKALGIDARTHALAVSAPHRAEEFESMRDRLTEPAEMGHLFKVLAISSDSWPIPEGFGPVNLSEHVLPAD
jgi:NADH dehydrogenase [ubiquinone] 1 alpha subcomplex assembly factor 7